MKPYVEGTPLEEIISTGWAMFNRPEQTVAEARAMGFSPTIDYVEAEWAKLEDELDARAPGEGER